jgi:hypothetical protein
VYNLVRKRFGRDSHPGKRACPIRHRAWAPAPGASTQELPPGTACTVPSSEPRFELIDDEQLVDLPSGYDIHSSPWFFDGPNRSRWFTY